MLEPLEAEGKLRRPIVPEGCKNEPHMYYVLLNEDIDRQKVLNAFKQHDIWSVFHYVPLHSSPAGARYGRAHGSLDVTDRNAAKLLRLPLWVGLSALQRDRVVEVLGQATA